MSNHQRGFLWLLAAVILLSSKGIFVKYVYQYDVTPMQLLLIRMLFSLPVYLVVLVKIWPQEKQSLNVSVVCKTVLFGVFGYYIASLLDLWGLEILPVSFERLILFTYPGLVVLFAAIWLKQGLNRSLILWLCVTYLGLVTIFAEDLLMQGLQSTQQLLAAVWVLIAAVSFALYMLGNEVMQKHVSSQMFTCVAMLGAAVFVLSHYTLLYTWQDLLAIPLVAYGWIFIIAIASTILPTFLVAAGIREVGASVAGVVSGLGPAITVVLAFILLDEQLSMLQLIGFVIVMFAVYQLQQSKNADR